MKSRSLFVLLLAWVCPDLTAQDMLYVGARAQYGFIWPHRPSNWILVEGHTRSLEVFAERGLRGTAPWHGNYPGLRYGLGVQYTDMANPALIGAAVRLLPYASVPIVQGKRGALCFRGGWGLGWIERPYDRRENPKQIAIGSRINLAIHIMMEYRLEIGRTALSAGISLDHWSNGSYRLPNVGINLPNLNVAVARRFGETPSSEAIPDTAWSTSKRREQLVVGGFSINERLLPHSGQFTAYSLSGHVRWRVSPKSSFGGGLDLFNKATLVTLHPELEGSGRLALTQAGMHGGWTMHFGKGEFIMQMGAYLYTPRPDEAAVYHRTGIRYRTGRHLLWNVTIKSHYAVADHLEFGIGYRWH